jgi:phage shock protein A
MNLFARMANLFRGFLSLFISDIEKNNPEIAYENSINSMIAKYSKLREATAAVIRRRDEIDERETRLQRDAAQVNADLEAALQTSQDDLALVLLQKKEVLAAELAEVVSESDIADKDADEAKQSLLSIKSEINKLKAEKDRMLAKFKSAQARVQIQGQLDGLSVDAEVQALDKVRENIKNKVSEANMGRELHDADIDVRLKKLQQTSGTITAQAKLDELKRQRAAAQQQSANKTL